jgi:hypothetical protein
MATVTVSTEKIICPNWKDHARHKHTMTEENIQTKYERLRAACSSSNNKPIPIVMHNLFSTKKFTAIEY